MSSRYEPGSVSYTHLYGGAGGGNLGRARTQPMPAHGHAQSLALALPPLSTLYFRHEGE